MMATRVLMAAMVLGVAGCAQIGAPFRADAPKAVQEAPEGPAPGTEQAPPPKSAVTVEQFDTTTAEERAAAAAPVEDGEKRLGTTIASLGDPADPGFWAETGMVDSVIQGRLENPANGKSVKVELRPSGGAAGSGTRVSLPALRVLEAPLTSLPELVVFGG
ncbi:D-galactarate dehydratase [Tropicimonas isoalkanivorans]|uniref:D-galactarate dehydratase n=1 Tax=Tropicimonas isoalkanivorans TaxID=441112 RepID=A0A1I1G917_9RHOB|nr:D-galactarate dehydratase [Tropicimonas isoalkanivorans]SFC08199.1 hypothetical protein SAMN04488094_102472 [Tropicimonas isoalkanivorans]